jgi:hypothetical protein
MRRKRGSTHYDTQPFPWPALVAAVTIIFAGAIVVGLI